MSKGILAILMTMILLAGCHNAEEDSDRPQKPKAREAQRDDKPASDRDQVESEVREGGLKDPGGAKSLRDEAAEQQKEQQDQVDEVDQ